MWSWRNNSSSPLIKCMFLYDRLCEKLDGREVEIINRLFVINVLRIIPYADEKTMAFLRDRLLYVEERIGI